MPRVARAFCTSRAYRAIAGRVLLSWALQGLRPTGEALEIGSGGGAMAAKLLAGYSELRLVATDYAPDVVAAAQRILAPFGERATVQRVDASGLPFEDDRFDLVLSFAMLHHVIDWERAVSEAVRVLRPGGCLVGYDLLDSAPLHRGENAGRRMIRAGRLEVYLGRVVPPANVRTRRSFGGFAVRFMATKARAHSL